MIANKKVADSGLFFFVRNLSSDLSPRQFSAYLHSRFSGKFAFEFAINTDQIQKIMFDYKNHNSVQTIKFFNALPSHPSVAGLGKVLGESYVGPLNHDLFFHYAAYKYHRRRRPNITPLYSRPSGL